MKLEEFLKGHDHFWLMHLTYNGDEGPRLWEYARVNGLIGLDLNAVNQDWNDFTDDEKKEFYWSTSSLWYAQFQAFCNKMKKDDIVVVMEGQKSILGIGTLKEDLHNFNLNLKTDHIFFDHFRGISWNITWDYDTEKRPFLNELLRFSNTLQRAPKGGVYWKVMAKVELKVN